MTTPQAPMILTKQQKGRRKKLLKRANNDKEKQHSTNNNNNPSWTGLTDRDEYEELLSLLNPTTTIAVQCTNAHTTTATTKPTKTIHAESPRDVLMELSQRLVAVSSPSSNKKNGTKKRPRPHHYNTPLTTTTLQKKNAVVRLHNVAALETMGVLEIHVNDSDKGLMPLDSSTAATTKVQWFQQDSRPRTISDALLYQNKEQQRTVSSSSQSNNNHQSEHWKRALTKLVLTSQQQEHHGYPQRLHHNAVVAPSDQSSPALSFSNSNHPKPLSMEDAEAFVRPYQVSISRSDDDNDNPLPPYVVTQEDAESSASKIWALDCEMVQTTAGIELGRLTLLQYHPESTATDNNNNHSIVILDTLVRPCHHVLDYKTKYSGLTKEQLDGPNTISLYQVQAFLLTTIRQHDTLIGHSLENDLRACRVVHDTVVDTAVLFSGNHSRKHSLRFLAKTLLQRTIQDRSQPHCSVEDAEAALELAIGRAQQGPSFGPANAASKKRNWLAAVSQTLNTTVAVGPNPWLQSHMINDSAVHALECNAVTDTSAKAIATYLTGPKRRGCLVWAKLSVSNDTEAAALKDFLDQLRTQLSSTTILCLAVQSGYEAAMELVKQKRLTQDARSSRLWQPGDEARYQAAMDQARTGQLFWVGGGDAKESS